jgi:hypothetical protein
MPSKPSLAALKDRADSYSKKAKEIQSKIKELENERFLTIGKEVAKYHGKDWEGFDQKTFQAFVKKALES